MSFKNFVHEILDTKELHDFYNFKERYVKNMKEKIERSENIIKESMPKLLAEEEAKKLFAKEIENEILIHKKKNEIEDKKEINNSVPSTEFINKVFANKDECFRKRQEIEKEMSPHPSLLKGINAFNLIIILEIQAKTRYGGNPQHKNTFYIIQAPENSSSYVSETVRFSTNGKTEVEKDREKKILYNLHRKEQKKTLTDHLSQNAFLKDYLKEEKDIFSQLQRSKKLYNYENVYCFIIYSLIN